MNGGTSAALTVALLAGLALLGAGTDGFRAFSTEGARRLAVERRPRELPAARLEDQAGAPFAFDDFRGRWLLVEFVYTRCPTLCTTLGLSFQRIARGLGPERLARDVALVSVSFDPEHDDRPALEAYAERFQADGRGWRIARLADRADLARLLDAVGGVVIPTPAGGFEHNGAIHMVGPDGRLTRIYDLEATDQVVAWLRARP